MLQEFNCGRGEACQTTKCCPLGRDVTNDLGSTFPKEWGVRDAGTKIVGRIVDRECPPHIKLGDRDSIVVLVCKPAMIVIFTCPEGLGFDEALKYATSPPNIRLGIKPENSGF